MLKVENLSKSFNDKVILNNISFQVADGENLVVFGRSGTGKSVLLKCLVRLLEPDSGRIYVQDKDVLSLNIKELNELRKQIGFLFQSAALYDSMTVRHNLEFPLVRNFNFTQKQREKKVISVLEKVSLLDAIDKMPSELSGGMKKRIGLARAIITEPKLMLYDEPTTGLDPITSKEISMLILELQKSLKMTSIIVTHDLLCAKIIADRAIMLNEGKIIFEGSLEKMTLSNDPFLNNFFKHDIINKQEYKNV
jgi:phospholipid/cholesterol/gamma-HCH transport system ATP-binding protein